MTVREALAEGAKTLRRHADGWGSGALDAEVLLGHALRKPKELLYRDIGERVSPAVLRRYRAFLKRHRRHEPVAFIVGEKDFFGLPFTVRRGACLIPRPETEMLVERAIELLHSSQWPVASSQSVVLDIGTGSGAIAIAVAKRIPDIRIVATDTSAAALSIARANARIHGVTTRISFKKADLLPPGLMARGSWLVLTNLPYVPTKEWRTLPPEIRRFEPRAALDGGPDGLDQYRRLLERMHDRFQASAWTLLAEIHPEQKRPFGTLVKKRFPRARVTFHRDLAGKVRVAEVKN